MAPKPKGRSWIDAQIAIITISMSLVLGLWNLFAGADRVKAERKVAEAMANPPEPVEVPLEVATVAPVVPELGTKIMLGGEAPQTVVTVERVIRRNGGGGGGDGGGSGGSSGGGGSGGGGGGGATSTGSS